MQYIIPRKIKTQMEKSRMNDDKIRFDGNASGEIAVHRLTGRMPELQRRYGLWIINCSTAGTSPAGSFRNCSVRLFEFY